MGGYAEPLHVVVCDDDDVDAELIVEALERESVADSYTHVDSGPALLAYLRDPKTPRPCLILLDLSMPGMNGHDTLRAVRGDRSIRDIVVCVYSTSGELRDVREAHEIGVQGYLKKPGTAPNETERVVRGIMAHLEYFILPHPPRV